MNHLLSPVRAIVVSAAYLLAITPFSAKADIVIDAFEAAPERWGANLHLSPEHHKQGQYSLHWPAAKRTRIAIKEIPSDWSTFRALSFWCYSEKATQNKIMLTFGSENPDTKGGDYYIYTFTVDWTGWKQIELPFTQVSSARRPAGWNKIDNLAFNSKGWDQTNTIPGTNLFLDDMKLLNLTTAELTELRKQQAALRPGRINRISDSEDLLEYCIWYLGNQVLTYL